MSKSLIFLLCQVVGLFSFTSCNAIVKKAPKTVVRKAGPAMRTLQTFDDFMLLQGMPLSAKYNSIRSVKVVYNIAHNEVFFLNAAHYKYHFEFCHLQQGGTMDLSRFNADNYGDTRRREYYLANLNYYSQSGIYALEFVSDDQINAAQLNHFYQIVKQATYIGDSLKLLVSTDYLVAIDTAGALSMPIVYPSDIYAGQVYQQLNPGSAIGRLRFLLSLDSEYTSVEKSDIIVVKGTPLNVPVCAGIITNSFQTPLSHINILCHNRNIPSAAYQTIWADATLKALNGKVVTLVVRADSLHITAAGNDDPVKISRPGQTRKLLRMKYNIEDPKIYLVKELRLDDAIIVGNKAAGMGALSKVARRKNSKFLVPEGGFAIPFYWYQKHIANASIATQLDKLLLSPQQSISKDDVSKQLKIIRRAIKDEPINEQLLVLVAQQIRSNMVGNSYRFRSSSNAEDKSGFSGAGLYDSKTGIFGDTIKSIEKAIKAVWASTWNDAAFEERAFYNIDQRTAMMGILCHRNFPDEACNGVAITRNLYRKGFPGYTVNVQVGEVSVVSPPESVICDQFVCINAIAINPDNPDITVDYVTNSNINNGKRVLTNAQTTQLFEALRNVKSYFYWNNSTNTEESFEDFALDVEFKFDKNGNLYLKQARPYR